MFAAGGRKLTSVLTGLERLRETANTKVIGPGFDGSESANRRGSNRSWAGWDES